DAPAACGRRVRHLVTERGVVLQVVQRRDGPRPVGEARVSGHILDALAAQPDLALLLLEALEVLRARPRWHSDSFRDWIVLLNLEILAGSGVRVALDEPRAGHLDPRPHAPDEALLEDGRDEHAVGDD